MHIDEKRVCLHLREGDAIFGDLGHHLAKEILRIFIQSIFRHKCKIFVDDLMLDLLQFIAW